MSVLAVALQIVGALALIIGAGFVFTWWASVAVGGVVLFAVGDALERR